MGELILLGLATLAAIGLFAWLVISWISTWGIVVPPPPIEQDGLGEWVKVQRPEPIDWQRLEPRKPLTPEQERLKSKKFP